MRLASWMRFETVMHQQEWMTAIEMLAPNIHLPDEQLLTYPFGQLCPGTRHYLHGGSASTSTAELPEKWMHVQSGSPT